MVRTVARDIGESAYLRVILEDWDWLRLNSGAMVPLVTTGQDGMFKVTQSIRCPVGEAEAWVWLRRVGPLPNDHLTAVECRRHFPMPNGNDFHGHYHAINPSQG